MKMAIWVSKVINSGKYSIAKFGAAGKEMQQVENLSITENELVPVYESEREASVVKGTKIGHSAYSAVFMDGMYEDGQRHDGIVPSEEGDGRGYTAQADKEVIAVDADMQTVSARELHEKLEVRYDFRRWTEYNFKDFSEGIDYFGVHIDVSGNQYGGQQSIIDYRITVDMAKHLCLMSKTEKGKLCREYLIAIQKAWNAPEQVMARALKIADKQIESLRNMNSALSEDVNRMKPKEVFADAVAASRSTILIGELAKLLRQNGIDTGEKRLFEWMRQKRFLISRKGTDYNMPTQRSMELKLFEVKERTINNPDGSVRITKTTVVTGKGQQYFINRFLQEQDGE